MTESFFSRRSFLIVVVAVFALPLIWAGTRRTIQSNNNDVRDWLPEGFEETAQHAWFQRHFPLEQFVLISWRGKNAGDPGCTLDDDRLELLAQKLVPSEQPPPGVEPVVEGEVVPASELADARIESPPQADPANQKPDKPHQPRLFKSVLTGPRLIKELKDRYPDMPEEEILKRLEGSLIGKDHYRTCLVVTLTKATEGRNLRPTLWKIRQLAEECGIRATSKNPEENEIRLGGPPVDNVAIDIEGERTLYRLAGLSAFVGLGISWLCLRSVRLTAMVFWIAILAAGVGMASVYFTGGTCDAVLLSMPSLVYVLAMSGAIHIINYYHDAIRDGVDLDHAPDTAIAHGALPCTMAAVTTALGLGSLMVSHVVPISKFGFYSALGVLATLALLFLYLPALLYYYPSRKFAEQFGGHGVGAVKDSVLLRFWRKLGGFVVGHNVLVSLGLTGVMILFAVALPRTEFSVKLMKLFSPSAEIIGHYRWLEHHLGPLVPMEVVLTVDNETCHKNMLERMRLAERIEHGIENAPSLKKDVGGALSAATFAPELKPYKGRGFGSAMRARVYERELDRGLERHRKEFRDYLTIDTERLETDDPTLRQLKIPPRIAQSLKAAKIKDLHQIEEQDDLTAVSGIGLEEAARVARCIAAWRAVRNPPLEKLGLGDELAAALKAKGIRDLRTLQQRRRLDQIEGVGQAGATQVASAIKNWRTAHGQELWRISARVNALSDTDYALFINDLRRVVDPIVAKERATGFTGIEARYTGLVPLVYKTQHELMRGLINSLISAFGLIALVMVLVLRNPVAGGLAMIPNVFPVIVIFGSMAWLGIAVDIGSMMTASVAMGVAVDDTMHYLAWYRHGLDQGLGRKGAAMSAYERCATAMTQTTLIGGLGLAVFAFSTFTPTQRFGTLMLALLFAALVGDLIFLPALLTGPLGRFFDRRPKVRQVPPRGELSADEDSGQAMVVPIEAKAAPLRCRRDSKHAS